MEPVDGPLQNNTAVTVAYANSLVPLHLRVNPADLSIVGKRGKSGTFGCFYPATLTGFHGPIGVKLITSSPAQLTETFMARFSNPAMAACFKAVKELQVLALLRSQYVVHCYGGFFRLVKGQLTCCIVMERYPHTLYSYYRTVAKDDGFESKVAMVGRLCRLLIFLTTQQVSHSDIKSNNILVSASGTPVLCDFGVSCAVGDNVARDILFDGDWSGVHTPSSFNVHKAARSPEATAVVDMHAFMCLFVELLYGSTERVYTALVHQPPHVMLWVRRAQSSSRQPSTEL